LKVVPEMCRVQTKLDIYVFYQASYKTGKRFRTRSGICKVYLNIYIYIYIYIIWYMQWSLLF